MEPMSRPITTASPEYATARASIEHLLAQYALAVDTGRFEDVAILLQHATVIRGDNSPMQGRDFADVLQRIVIMYDDGTPRTRHVMTNLLVELDEGGQSASSRSNVTALQQVPGGPLQIIACATYTDRFARAGGSWRFVERRIVRDFVGDISRHVHDG